MRVVAWIKDVLDRVEVAYLRRKILNRKLEGLTDPTFLDRALAGEEEAA